MHQAIMTETRWASLFNHEIFFICEPNKLLLETDHDICSYKYLSGPPFGYIHLEDLNSRFINL